MNPSKPNGYLRTSDMFFVAVRIKFCSDNSNYTFLGIQVNQTNILALWTFTMFSNIICIAGRIKRCQDKSNYTFLSYQANKTNILAH